MRINNKHTHLIIAGSILLLLIWKADIAAAGALEGVQLCTQVIIPSLFPFFFITAYMIPLLTTVKFPGIRQLCKSIYIPSGCEGLLMLGLIGGYPVGAQAINSAFKTGNLSKEQAYRLMGFCSNAGPSFIFGVTASLFPSKTTPWLLWFIHIVSALLTALIIPKPHEKSAGQVHYSESTILQAFQQSLRITASVCGWVILFKVVLAIFFSAIRPQNGIYQAIITGILELSGGCIALSKISNLSLRFILCSALLSFGGVCVFMQTASVAAGLGTGLYLPGKLIQTLLSTLLSLLIVLVQDISALSGTFVAIIYLTAIPCIIMLRYVCRKKLWKLCYV